MSQANASSDQRLHILAAARNIISSKGYSAVGLTEILAAAQVPKGSFYYYFKSKDAFGEALISHYFQEYLDRMDALFSSTDKTAAQCLLEYFGNWQAAQETNDCQGRCLAVKLGAEVADLSEAMRLSLKAGAQGVVSRLTKAIQNGLNDGTVSIDCEAELAANTLYQLWLGASWLAKITRNNEPFLNAFATTKHYLKIN
jgi:TetR/AcrR family transcriptional repressor of nem operon